MSDAGFEPVPGDPERLLGVARALRDVTGDLSQRTDEVDGATARAIGEWTGRRALDSRLAASGVGRAVAASVAGVAELADALGELAVAAGRAREEVERLRAQAARAHRTAEARVAALPAGDPRSEHEQERARSVHRGCLGAAADERAAYDRVAARVGARIEEIADGAAGAVAVADPARLGVRLVEGGAATPAWSVLESWLHPTGSAAAVPGLSAVLRGLAARGGPAAAYAWWQSLSPVQQQVVLREHPATVGNLDGLPGWARDLANRERLGPLRRDTSTRLRARLDALTLARSRAAPYDSYLGSPVPLDRDPELVRLGDRLRALTVLGAVLARPGRRLLGLDLSGRRVHAAVAVGDVDTADNVAVLTPGVGSSVEDGMDYYDTEMDALRARVVADSTQSGATTATVAWLGYDAPRVGDTLDPRSSMASSHLARQGAVGLAGFLGGVHASRPQGVHLTALGHSYGSTTTGYALARGPVGVDDVAMFGSPGAGVRSVDALHVPVGHLYVESAPADPVAVLHRFGLDPSATPGFQPLRVVPAASGGTALRGVSFHTHYLDPGTTSQWNLAAVVAGRRDLILLATDPPVPADHVR